MKNLASFKDSASTLRQDELKSVKGGNGYSATIETEIDICFVDANGAVHNIYCDRRRRRVGSAN